MDSVLLVAGLLLLVLGGDALVRGAVSLAERLGLSPLVIGLTLVGFGTSTPELVTSVQASLAGAPGIAVGNIVGSNIANVLLIVGLSALIAPIAVEATALKRDGAIMVLASLVFFALALTLPLDRPIGLGLLVLLVAYIGFAFITERKSAAGGAVTAKADATRGTDPAMAPGTPRPIWLALVFTIGGLALVIVGGRLLVDGAVGIARDLAIPETVIGLTIVAVGTSMPELVTSLVAAARKQSAVAFGNVVGSNIYNVLGIGGATAAIAPVTMPSAVLTFDLPVMILVSVALVVFAWTGLQIGRREGAILLAGYFAYLAWLWPN